jgi:hypothetical protein
VGELDSSRCATCGHVPLLLLAFDDGAILRARFGCPCSTVRLYPITERLMESGHAAGDVGTVPARPSKRNNVRNRL